jgi:hypothetical protein
VCSRARQLGDLAVSCLFLHDVAVLLVPMTLIGGWPSTLLEAEFHCWYYTYNVVCVTPGVVTP